MTEKCSEGKHGKKEKKCPRCGSTHTEMEGDDVFCFLICLDCGFDESLEFESGGESDRKKGGGGGSPYKRGGALRTQRINKNMTNN